MLGCSNTLITRNNIYSQNIKDITMSSQQVSIKDIFLYFKEFLCNLRDFTKEAILFIWLRYSPIFFNDISYLLLFNNISINKILRKNLSSSSVASNSNLDPN
jgi:hypothetical protein